MTSPKPFSRRNTVPQAKDSRSRRSSWFAARWPRRGSPALSGVSHDRAIGWTLRRLRRPSSKVASATRPSSPARSVWPLWLQGPDCTNRALRRSRPRLRSPAPADRGSCRGCTEWHHLGTPRSLARGAARGPRPDWRRHRLPAPRTAARNRRARRSGCLVRGCEATRARLPQPREPRGYAPSPPARRARRETSRSCDRRARWWCPTR